MDYRNYNNTVYIRLDRGDEIISRVKEICQKEQIRSAIFSGIGGCSRAEIQTFVPEKQAFETRVLSGMLELVSLNGNIICDEGGALCAHTHGLFAHKEGEAHFADGGHLRSVTVLYTAEIELRPVIDGTIYKRYDPETGTGFWEF